MRRTTLVALLAVGAIVVGGGGFVIGSRLVPDGGGEPQRTASPTASPSPSERATTPPLAKAWADRPTVDLSYDIAHDHESAKGVATVSFTPDRRVCDALVFRSWPNKPEIADHGGSMTVRSATVDGRKVSPAYQRKGAPSGSQGTLFRLPLRDCVAAGSTVEARISFTVEMARQSGERVGTNGSGEMWLASAYPVLAWERGHGWMTQPAVDVFGEMDGTEEFRLDLDVVAPQGDTVLGMGRPLGTSKGPRDGTTRHRFAADPVRNVAVGIGGYRVTTREIGGVRTRVGVSDDGSLATANDWLDKIELELGRLEGRFGRFPYRDLWVTVIPDTTGIEFPGAIFYGDYAPQEVHGGDLVAHELAHMWFYGLVGNDQGRDPWLDESFATYAQALADNQAFVYRQLMDIPSFAANRVGEPMTFWEQDPEAYGAGVYRQGAQMLFEARERAGERKWDAAIRAYLARNAHRIVRPEDFVDAVDHLPGAVETLRKYGAV